MPSAPSTRPAGWRRRCERGTPLRAGAGPGQPPYNRRLFLPPPAFFPLNSPILAAPRALGRTEWAPAPTAVVIGASCLAWALIHWVAHGNLDSYHDMLETYAWSQAWDWGTHKHPPFFAWVAGLWFAVFPQNDLSYRLLVSANVGLGLWGVLHLAKRLGLGPLGPSAALLLLWSFPYTTLAAKFNANSQLLSLWPWTAALLLASWQEQRWRGAACSMALGLLAAASMLSKYYSGVFLLGLLLPTLLTAEGWRWLQSPRPYLALAVFALALAPHMAWVAGHDGVTLAYAADQGGGAVQWAYVLRFALAPLFYWLPGWLACVAVFGHLQAGASAGRRLGPTLARLAWQSWRPTGWADTVFWLACMPWALTLAFGLTGAVELSSPWAIPIGFAFPLLWLRNLQNAAPGVAAGARALLLRGFWPALGAFLLLGGALSWSNARSGDTGYYRPSAEAAQAIAQDWAERHPDLPLGWVGGDWAENALLAFYALPQARTLPGLPDRGAALFNPHPRWASEAGLLLCPRGPYGADGTAPERAEDCEDLAEEWLQEQGLPHTPRRIEVQRQGWRFPQSHTFVYAVFDVMPTQSPEACLPRNDGTTGQEPRSGHW